MRIIGVDPGKLGGISSIDVSDEPVAPGALSQIVGAAAVAMPQTEETISNTFRLLRDTAPGGKCMAYIERVHAMPSTREVKDRTAAVTLCKQILGRFDNQVVMQLEAAGVGTSINIIQGSVGTFTFGQGYGFLRGCLVTLKIKFEDVRPIDWQNVNGCRTGGNKNISKNRAIQLFPSLNNVCRITHKTADALLIAHYGYKLLRSDQLMNRR